MLFKSIGDSNHILTDSPSNCRFKLRRKKIVAIEKYKFIKYSTVVPSFQRYMQFLDHIQYRTEMY